MKSWHGPGLIQSKGNNDHTAFWSSPAVSIPVQTQGFQVAMRALGTLRIAHRSGAKVDEMSGDFETQIKHP